MNRTPERELLRLNRYLARSGSGSRRRVEEFISAGRVTVNGQVVLDLGRRVDPDRDEVALDGSPIRLPRRWRVYAFHKPSGTVSTLRAQPGQHGLLTFRQEADLADNLVPVGRLDVETSGLLLWTDDGDLAQALCRPASEVWKRYELRLDAPLRPADLAVMRRGELRLDGRPCRAVKLTRPRREDPLTWHLEMHEGRKRQIRRMFGLLERKVLTLHRIGVGPVELGRLAPGGFRRLKPAEELALRQAAGMA